MALRVKIKREVRPSSFSPPPQKGEVVLNVRPAEAPEKKKSKTQLQQEALDNHMREWKKQFEKDQQERQALLKILPF